jgi:hypothetical protein
MNKMKKNAGTVAWHPHPPAGCREPFPRRPAAPGVAVARRHGDPRARRRRPRSPPHAGSYRWLSLDFLLIVGLVRQELEHGTAYAPRPTDAAQKLDDLGLGPLSSSRPPALCEKAAGQLEPAPLAQERLNSRPRPARQIARQSGRPPSAEKPPASLSPRRSHRRG